MRRTALLLAAALGAAATAGAETLQGIVAGVDVSDGSFRVQTSGAAQGETQLVRVGGATEFRDVRFLSEIRAGDPIVVDAVREADGAWRASLVDGVPRDPSTGQTPVSASEVDRISAGGAVTTAAGTSPGATPGTGPIVAGTAPAIVQNVLVSLEGDTDGSAATTVAEGTDTSGAAETATTVASGTPSGGIAISQDASMAVPAGGTAAAATATASPSPTGFLAPSQAGPGDATGLPTGQTTADALQDNAVESAGIASATSSSETASGAATT